MCSSFYVTKYGEINCISKQSIYTLFMECWNAGIMEYWVFDLNLLNPSFHCSILPLIRMGGAHVYFFVG